MNELLGPSWPLILIGALIVLVALWWAILATRKTRVTLDRRDTLDEGAAPAARNQALIDAPAAAVNGAALAPPPVPEAIGGAGVAVAAAVENARVAAASGTAGELTQIKGLGPKLAASLNEMGVTSLAQVAAWSDADIDRIDAGLGRFQGRIRRDQWVEQAKLLLAGDQDAYAARFGAR